MNDDQYETVVILAGLIRRAKSYNNGLTGKELAVPVTTIAEALEKFTTTQTQPPIKVVKS